MRESALQSKLKKKLTALGYIVIKNTNVHKAGWPDIVAYRNGTTTFIEVKTPGQSPSELQLFRHRELIHQDFKVYIIDSNESLNDLLNILQNG